ALSDAIPSPRPRVCGASHEVRGGNMHIRTKRILGLGAALTLSAAVVVFTTFVSAASGSAQHVRWDIISSESLPVAPPLTLNPGGVASAQTPEGATITLTGSGTFVA